MEQLSIYQQAFFVRLIIGIMVLNAIHLKPDQVIYLLPITMLIDLIDSAYVRLNDLKRFNIKLKTKEYQKYDKLADIIIYLFVICIFASLFTNGTFILLWILITYRAIGVWYFWNDTRTKYLHIFVDAINSTIAVYGLSKLFPFVSRNYIIFVIIGFIAKYIFEKIHHSSKQYNAIDNLDKMHK
jgi:hypothetical protein